MLDLGQFISSSWPCRHCRLTMPRLSARDPRVVPKELAMSLAPAGQPKVTAVIDGAGTHKQNTSTAAPRARHLDDWTKRCRQQKRTDAKGGDQRQHDGAAEDLHRTRTHTEMSEVRTLINSAALRAPLPTYT